MSASGQARSRIIQVAAGRPHTRSVSSIIDPNHQPIVEKMTPARLRGLTPAQVESWKTESIQAIFDHTEAVSGSGQVSIRRFCNSNISRPSPRAPAARRHTREAPSPIPSPPKKKLKYHPQTPPGVTPSKRDGTNAALLDAYSPYYFE